MSPVSSPNLVLPAEKLVVIYVVEDETRVEIKEILKNVQDDPSLIINEITPGNWDQWMEKSALPKLFKKEYSNNKNHEDIAKLYNLVSLRDLMGEFIWLILAGFLVITTQTNALYSINCKGESSKVEKKIQEQWEKLENRAKPSEKKRIIRKSCRWPGESNRWKR